MSSSTQTQRLKMPLSDFAWPEARKYPILDQSDVDAASTLLGKAPEEKRGSIKARIKAIARRKGFKIPDAWKEGMVEGKSMIADALSMASTRAFGHGGA